MGEVMSVEEAISVLKELIHSIVYFVLKRQIEYFGSNHAVYPAWV